MIDPSEKKPTDHPDDEFEPGIGDPYRFEAPSRQPGFARVSKVMLVIGAILSAVGVVGGLGPIVFTSGEDKRQFMNLLMLAPVGVILMFAGITGWVIAGGR
ncbi:hypothetical protein ABGV17_03755 [Guyparkeria sp. GHLCS8-2]|uniref:hypothetical protein n=1 Tax=Guyparkeria halopsychrophila TaxID=3139421 RepID=UPI0037C9762A